MADGWAGSAPHDDIEALPLSDGGPGFLDVLQRALGGVMVAAVVSDPLGRDVPAAVLVVEEEGRRTAYVEAAQASGLHLLGADERNPGLTSTWGVGQLLETAVGEGATRVVIGAGGGSTNDGGAGTAGGPRRRARLGARPRWGGAGRPARRRAPRPPRGDRPTVGGGPRARHRRGHPPPGPAGHECRRVPRKGATPEQAQALEAALGRFTDVLGRALPPPLDLLTGRPARLDRELGAGAAGGLGYALLSLGARRVGAVSAVLRRVRLRGGSGAQRRRRHRHRAARLVDPAGLGGRGGRRGGGADRAPHRCGGRASASSDVERP